MKKEFYYKSNDVETEIHAIEWIPKVQPIAILQIAHGMVEFIDRYHDFATFLAKKGVYVVGNDHLGHGFSVKNNNKLGYFSDNNGNGVVLADIHSLRLLTVEKYPELPYFVLGHSMGSFLMRQYVQSNGGGLAGAVIMGTGSQPNMLLNVAKGLTSVIATFKGWNHRSKFIDNLSFGSYNKTFKPQRTTKDWLSRDNSIVDAYLANPLNTFLFTLNGYKNLFVSIKSCQDKKNIAKTPNSLPMLFVSGDKDPVGGFGKGVKTAMDGFVNVGVTDIELKLYNEYRHEILNEIDKQVVYDDIISWISSKAPRR